jgi:uncharacterized membrane protein
MRPISIIGVVLIILGVIGLATGGFSYTKNKETADLGPIDISVKEKEHVGVPTWLSVAAVAGGVVLLVAGARRRDAT